MSRYEVMGKFLNKGKPFFAAIILQFWYAGLQIICKAALNQGMSNYVLVVYRHAVATVVMAPFALYFDKNIRPKLTCFIFIKFMILGLLEPAIDQNLLFLGMKATTATFTAAMCNVLPAITFVMACILRVEKLKLKSIHSQAKVIGTVISVGGAMMMTLMKGPILELFWTKERSYDEVANKGVDFHHSLKGALMISVGCFSWSAYMILQAITLKYYPAALSLTAWICLLGAAEGAIVALIMERGNTAVWAIKWDISLAAYLYSGIVCSGLTYYIQGLLMKERGPVFVTAFNPVCMIIVAVMGSIVLAEQMYLGRVIGAMVIVAGLYLLVWGKSKDEKVQSLPVGEQIAPEKQILDEEFEENCNHSQVVTIKASDGDPNHTTVLS